MGRQLTHSISITLLVFILLCLSSIANAQDRLGPFQALPRGEIVRAVEWNSDGTKYVTANPNGQVTVRDDQGNLLWSQIAYQTDTYAVSWSPDDNYIASGGSDAWIHIWDSDTGELIRSFQGALDGNDQVLWTSDGESIAILGFNMYGIWNATTGERVGNIGGRGTVWNIALSPVDDRTVTVSATANVVVASRSNSGNYLMDVNDPDSQTVPKVAWNPDGTEVVTGSFSGAIRVWDMVAYSGNRMLVQLPSNIHTLEYSPDGSKIVASAGYYTLYVIDSQSGVIFDVLEVSTPVVAVAWHPDSSYFIYGESDGTMTSVTPNTPPIPNAGTDQTVGTLNSTASVTLDGSGSSDADGSIVSYIWTDSTGAQVATGVSPTVDLPVGVHPLTLTVTDDDGATASDDVVITVVGD